MTNGSWPQARMKRSKSSVASRVVAVFSSGWQLTSANASSASSTTTRRRACAIVDQRKRRDRARRDAEHCAKELGVAEAQASEAEARGNALEIDARIVLGDDQRHASVPVGEEQVLGVGAWYGLAQRSRLLDREHRLVLHRDGGDAELFQPREEFPPVSRHRGGGRFARPGQRVAGQGLDPGVILLSAKPEARPMDIGRGINYNARQCLQARTGWVWQERDSRPGSRV